MEKIEINSERWLDVIDLENEEWKDIEGYEGLYQISNCGRVKSFYCGKEKIRKTKIRIDKSTNRLTPYTTIEITLRKDKNQITHRISRLVARAFIPNPEGYYSVDHIDRDTKNNYVSNLRWANSFKQNKNKSKYKNSSVRKISQEELNEMYEMSKIMPLSDIGNKFRLNKVYINALLSCMHPDY